MASTKDKLDTALAAPFGTPVYYFASTVAEPLREVNERVMAALLNGPTEADYTRIDGPAPDLGSIIEAAGTISLFGTPRVVDIRLAAISQMSDKDAAELGSLFAQLENAVLVVTVLYRDKKAAGTKKAKALFDAAATAGYAAELAKPTRRDNLAYLRAQAARLGATYAPGAAELLLDNAGEERPLLKSETEKLAAICGYGEIPVAAVEAYGARNIEADVFQLSRLITSGQRAASYEKLNQLFALRHEPIAIAAALAGSFVDMYRVRCGSEKRVAVGTIFKELGYKGNDYRLQKAKENAARYSTRQLEACVLVLYELDRELKSSALADKAILVQAAVGQLLQLGARR